MSKTHIRLITMACLAALLLAVTSTIAAQDQGDDRPKPDRWRGMIINESTPEDAIKAFGKSAEDKMDRLRAFGIDSNWLTANQKQKIFRRLTFKKLDGVKQVALSFQNDKLVMIDVWLEKEKEVAAAALSNIYGLEFTPQFSGFSQALSPGNFERNQGKVFPKNYPTVYYLVAVTPQTFISAMAANVGFGAALRDVAGVPDGQSFPGKVGGIQIISRKLENRDGADALK